MEIAEIRQLAEQELTAITKAFDEQALTQYGRDSYTLYHPAPSLILFPTDINQVAQIIRFANRYKIPVVPSGGRTGLCGGATAIHGELILSSKKLVAPLVFNNDEDTVNVMAGVITQQLQQEAGNRGLLFPIDFAATGSSNIGGNIATNAGGIHVIHYGLMRDWVTGLKVVTGKGEILDLNKGLTKNARGYDLRHLFIGSEGTLGIIVEATIKLVQKPTNQPTLLLLGFKQLDDVISILSLLKAEVDLLAFEFFTDEALQVALDEATFALALDAHSPFYVIVEYELRRNSAQNQTQEEADQYIINKILDTGLVDDGKMAYSQAERTLFWKHRENIPAAINKFQPYKNDISIRIKHIPQFIKQLETLINTNYSYLKVLWFGHIGDGNLHVNILKPADLTIEQFRSKCDELSVELYQLIQKFEGSISAEHGVGLNKKKFLTYTRSPEEIAYMKLIKQVFDPNNILNPGKIFDK